MCGLSKELQIFFFDCFENRWDSNVCGQFLNSVDRCFSVLFLRHFIDTCNAHSACDFTVFLTGAFLVVFHNDRKHHCACNTVRGIINSAQGVCHGVSDSKTYVGEAHTCDVLAESHSLTPLFGVCNSAAQGFGDQLDGFQMEHIGHFPCSFCGVALDSVGQSVHTGGSGQSFRHGGHHLRINNCDDRHVVRVNAYEFTFSLYVGDNVVDGNLCSSTCCGRNSDDRYAGILGRCSALKASDILELRVCDDDTDGFGSIHGRTAADCDQIISAGCLESFYAVFYVFDGRVWFDVAVKLIVQSVLGQDIGYFGSNVEFYQIRVRAYECFFEAVCLCLVCDFSDSACSVIGCSI